MKNLLRNTVLTSLLVAGCLLSACHDEEVGEMKHPRPLVEVAESHVSMLVEDTLRLPISKGSGQYTYDNTAPNTVGVTIRDTTLWLIAKAEGTAWVRVKDRKTAAMDSLLVTVRPKPTPITANVLIENHIVKLWSNDAIPEDGRVVLAEGIKGIAQGAFINTNIREIWLPSTLRFIGEEAFAYCLKLRSVHLPEGVDSLATDAFYQCHGLESLSLPSTLRTMGANVFAYCDKLTTVELAEGLPLLAENAFIGCTALTQVTLPKSLRHLGEGVFKDCASLASIALPEGIDSIPNGAFLRCHALRSVSLPIGVKQIGRKAFYDCKQLQEVAFPSTLKRIQAGAFSECKSLKQAHFSEGLETLEYASFEACVMLQELKLPTTLRAIGGKAFRSCHSIPYLHLPEGVQEIGNFAFHDNYSARSVTLPSTLKNIGNNAFTDCPRLREVRSYATTPPTLGYKVFLRTPRLKKLYVPKGTLSAYQQQAAWVEAAFSEVSEQ